jgi:exodeoxyribonuclease VII large subunit
VTLASSRARVWGIAQLLRHVRLAIAKEFGSNPILVRGELAKTSTSPGGHVYFAIKEAAATLNCRIPEAYARRLVLPPAGSKVDVEGTLGFYDARGQFQLTVTRIEVVGDGSQAARLEKLKIKLRAAGYFDRARKRPMPKYPFHLALVASEGSDGENDFRTALRERAPFVRVTLFPTLVQGPFAADAIASAIRKAGRSRFDAIVVARGGGSEDDRMAFNEEAVAVAIFQSPLPLLTAIGHQADHHVADDVADAFSDNPLGAAVDLTAHAYRAFSDLRVARRALNVGLRRRIIADAGRLRDARARLSVETARTIDQRSLLLDDVTSRLPGAARHNLSLLNSRLHALLRRLDARSPAAQLAARAARLELHKAALEAAVAGLFPVRRATIEQQRVTLQRALSRAAESSAGRLRDRREGLERSGASALDRKGRKLAVVRAKLYGSNPEAILQRGYAIVRIGGRAVQDAAGLVPGDRVEAKLARGSLTARVEEIVSEEKTAEEKQTHD